MHLPRRLRETAELDVLDEDDDQDVGVFRELLLDALRDDPDVQAAVRQLAGPAKPPQQPRSARHR